ncbi:hypothetical protein [Morganella psychrotolerans]|uniref:hypothetical protein n=1 Tax=Morganella psychrotolerans TaxID=368603 RepID=UPI0039B070EB
MGKIWGFIGALFIAIMTLVYGYYSSTKSLMVSRISHDVIISPSAQIDGIGIYYGGEKISNLSKTIFVMENTGRVSIKDSDVASPLTIGLSNDNTKVFDFILSGSEPSNIGATSERKGNSITINFSLLNPGDRVNVSILSDSIDPPELFGIARIEGIKNIDVKNDTKENGILYEIFLWVCLAFSFISILVCIGLYFDARKEKAIKIKMKNKMLIVPDDTSKLQEWVENTFVFYSKNERQEITRTLNNKLNLENSEKIKIIENISKGFSSNIGASVMSLILGSVGGWYSLSSLGFF